MKKTKQKPDLATYLQMCEIFVNVVANIDEFDKNGKPINRRELVGIAKELLTQDPQR